MPARAKKKIWSDAELLLRAANERFRAREKNTRELRIAADAYRDRGRENRADFLEAVAALTDSLDAPDGSRFGACHVDRWGYFRVWKVTRPTGGTRPRRRCWGACWIIPGTGGREWLFRYTRPGGTVDHDRPASGPAGGPGTIGDLRVFLARRTGGRRKPPAN
jgi:hypothetical protein